MDSEDLSGATSSTPDITEKSLNRRRTKKKTFSKALVATLVVIAIAAVFLPKVVSFVSGPPDFPGPGNGSVQVQISPGQNLSAIGNTLKALGVVKSVDSFTAAASKNSDSESIAPGAYNLRLKMKSSDAILALLDPINRIVTKVVIPEGKRLNWILEKLANQTGLPPSDFEAAVSKAANLGLPSYANGNPEGFLFPATYEFAPGTTAEQIIGDMIARYNIEATNLDIEARAAKLGLTTYEIVTVASLLEVEGHPRDFGKVARVVYNRLSEPMPLQFDSSVNYGLGKTDVILTTELLQKDTPYNVYLHQGLPPTPIDSPGRAAMEAALNPAIGDWLFFITTDLNTQETKFTRSYNEFLVWKAEFLAFCDATPGVCY